MKHKINTNNGQGIPVWSYRPAIRVQYEKDPLDIWSADNDACKQNIQAIVFLRAVLKLHDPSSVWSIKTWSKAMTSSVSG